MKRRSKPNVTQEKLLLRYFESDNRPLTQRMASRKFGIDRLGARIWDLKKKNLIFKVTRVTGKNRFGNVTNVAAYQLKTGRNR